MDTAFAATSSKPAAGVVAEPAPPWLTAARSGRMPLPEVMERASALQAAGDADARLYKTWIACTASPLRHVACFNWGTLLSARGRNGDAESAYQQALSHHPGFAPALLNLRHLHERRGDRPGALARGLCHAAVPCDLRLHARNNSGRLLEALKRYTKSEALMRQSLLLKAAQPDVIQHNVHIRHKQCAWPHDLAVGEVHAQAMLDGQVLAGDDGFVARPAIQLLTARRLVDERVAKPTAQARHRRMRARTGRARIG